MIASWKGGDEYVRPVSDNFHYHLLMELVQKIINDSTTNSG
jgi:hypothetical protein